MHFECEYIINILDLKLNILLKQRFNYNFSPDRSEYPLERSERDRSV